MYRIITYDIDKRIMLDTLCWIKDKDIAEETVRFLRKDGLMAFYEEQKEGDINENL